MSLADSIFIFGLALIIFGPKKLPEIARQLGKIMHDFRRASNEFKLQFEEELRTSEVADRQKKIADTSAVTNPIPPSEAPAVSSESLTVRPPSTGTTESADNPYKPVSVADESTETAAGEPDSSESGTYDAVDSEWTEQTDTSAAKNPIPPPAEPAASSSESLTVQQPSAASMEDLGEDLGSPYTPVPDGMTEAAPSEPDSTGSGTHDAVRAERTERTNTSAPKNLFPHSGAPAASASESLTIQKPSAAATEDSGSPYKLVSIAEETTEPAASEQSSGAPEITGTMPTAPEPTPYAGDESQADKHQDLQEQATNHHG